MINLTLILPHPVMARLMAAADEERVTVERLAELCLTAAVAMYTVGDRPPIQKWKVDEVAVNLALERQEDERKAIRSARLSADRAEDKIRRAPPRSVVTPPAPPARFGPTALVDASERQCRWDVGSGHVCGKQVVGPRKSYCSEHDAVVHGRKAVAA